MLSFSTAPDYEMPNSNDDTNVYYVRIKVTDNGSPAKSDTEDLIVEVTNVNEAPTLTSPTTSIMVPENTAATTVLATYTGSDPDSGDSLFWFIGRHRRGTSSTSGSEKRHQRRVRAAHLTLAPDYEMPG